MLEERKSQRWWRTIRKQHLLDPAGEGAELTVVNNSPHKTCARLNLPIEMGIGHAILPSSGDVGFVSCWERETLSSKRGLW